MGDSARAAGRVRCRWGRASAWRTVRACGGPQGVRVAESRAGGAWRGRDGPPGRREVRGGRQRSRCSARAVSLGPSLGLADGSRLRAAAGCPRGRVSGGRRVAGPGRASRPARGSRWATGLAPLGACGVAGAEPRSGGRFAPAGGRRVSAWPSLGREARGGAGAGLPAGARFAVGDSVRDARRVRCRWGRASARARHARTYARARLRRRGSGTAARPRPRSARRTRPRGGSR